MKNFGKIVGINLAVLLAYSLGIRLSAGSSYRGLGILIASAYALGFHVAGCLLIVVGAYAGGYHKTGKLWLATTGVVLLLGFFVCLGNVALG